jgi:PKD repeat protein
MKIMSGILRNRRLSTLATVNLSLLLLSGITNAAPPESPPGATPPTRVFPSFSLPERANGEEAISALGAKLPNVAAYYGMTTANFARMLREDHSAWIDQKGRVFFIDELREAATSESDETLGSAPFPLAQTFTLSSRPGSARVIYLDFDGHTTTGTAWNSDVDPIYSPAYSSEGDATFSAKELGDIQKMWRQVAEDFAPFDVNVTTQDPGQAAISRSGSGDLNFGTRVVITTDNFYNCGCGGVAYLRAFDDTYDNYKPAWVFNKGVGGAGEAISHEVGHNLGLSHDGTSAVGYYTGHGSGATGWAPIMGVGYYQDLVQWSKGEYDDASTNQDDIALIQNYGAPLMADDHGDIASTASILDAATNGTTATLSGNGLIRRSEDVDVFSFVAGTGSYAINVDPAYFGPNLDIAIELRNSAGALIASANPGASLPAALSGNLSAGAYFLYVDGAGKGNPLNDGYSDYGSIGRYAVSGTIPDPGGLAAPVAVAAALSYNSDVGPLYVGFSAEGSTDSDGDILSWDWDFGDGNSASGELVNHTFNDPGSYTVNLIVEDSDGLGDNDSLTVVVLNQPPVAVATSDTSSGAAPVVIQFTGNASYDPDDSGSIATYSWNFGDGNSSNDPNPSHGYEIGGQINAELTVTDNLGGTDFAIVALDIDEPPFVDRGAIGELAGSGTVSGTYAITYSAGLADGEEQWIRERESGGKKNSRYSFLQHTWLFNVQPGGAVTLILTGRQTASSDGDQMEFSYSIGGGAYQDLPISLTTTSTSVSAALPGSASGDVRIRVNDSNQVNGRSLDTVYVDEMFIRTESATGGSVPLAANLVDLSMVSSSQIDVSWIDNSTDEYGFRIEHSTNGTNWSAAGSVAADQTRYSDTGLAASTQYYYRIVAYNGSGDAEPSAENLSVYTDQASAVNLTASGYKQKGVKHATLTWAGLGTANVFRDGNQVATGVDSGHDDNIRSKGAGSHVYQICEGDFFSTCSNQVTIVF